MSFNPSDYEDIQLDRYQTYIDSCRFETKHITNTVESSIKNLKQGKSKSFVIYGEPQSGKTSMMIALTAKLLDEGYKLIIVLVQDNLFLESQNLSRFEDSTLNPSPKRFIEILPKDFNIKDRELVIFCKKNSSNLLKLLKKVDSVKNKVIIDDEADYASPNSKINKVDPEGERERTRINERIFNLLKNDGVYIGVTATPARLDLNNTFQNENHKWVFFQPHGDYKGQDFFFPINSQGNKFAVDYNLYLLNDESYNPSKELRDSIYRFLVSSTYLNLYSNKEIKNYVMLIHTSVKMENHTGDKKVTNDLFSELAQKKGSKFLKHMEEIYKFAVQKTDDEEKAKKICQFIAKNADKHQIGVLNSDRNNKLGFDLKKFSEDPSSLFTISIGGNIISRGITFNNLLSMFFTRGVKGLMQQDTYIQRARMFGNRGNDAYHFELTIPDTIYKQWFSCFLLHRLSYLSAKNNLHQVWLEGSRTRAVAPGSIDKSYVRIDKGEISFSKIKFNNEMESLPSENLKQILINLNKNYGNEFLPLHVIDFISAVSYNKDQEIAIHGSKKIESWTDGNYNDISRPRGIFGNFDYNKFPLAKHHFMIVKNEKGFARIFYNFRHGTVSFLRNTKDKINPIDLNQFVQVE
tara:strand:+ start:147 stop:2048 length:1902 start_codon:yes stop_codon:yes gene_type:complete